MRFIEIRNIKNTPDDALPPGYSSWLDYWETKKGRKAYTCSVIDCRNKPDLGGHVRDAEFGHKGYILPMCRSCHGKSAAESFGAWTDDLLFFAVPISSAGEGSGVIGDKDSEIIRVDSEIQGESEDRVADVKADDERVIEDVTADKEGIDDAIMVNNADNKKNDDSTAFGDRKDAEKEGSGAADLNSSDTGEESSDRSRMDQIIRAYRAKMGRANMTKTDIVETGIFPRQAEEDAKSGDEVYRVEKKGMKSGEFDGRSAGDNLVVADGKDEAIPIEREVPAGKDITSARGAAIVPDTAFAGDGGERDIEPVPATPRIYLASPHMGDKELAYVKDAFESNWIAPLGPHVNHFEKEIAEYVGSNSAVALNSGTAAIHLALKALDVKEGDMVFCSTFTFAGSCNPILYMNAVPVFIDSEPQSLNMSPFALEQAFQKYRPKAVIVVNLYGQSADYDKLVEICNRYNTPIIEDAAESLGATYKGRMSGTFGKLGIFSFNGNKIITTSGGGMVVSDDEEMIEKIRFWATQARDPAKHYQHSELGYNYRLSNICAAIGRGQMTVLEERIAQKKRIYNLYREAFANEKYIMMMPICDYGEPNYWLSVMMIKEGCVVTPMEIIDALEKENIESRPVWKPMHLQPLYAKFAFYNHLIEGFSIAGNVYQKGLCLPSDTKMERADIERIIDIVKKVMN